MKKLSHLDAAGRARMVDVGEKAPSRRRAVASAWVPLAAETVSLLESGSLAKGDALAVARVAGIQGAKQTSSLVPLCHPLSLDHVAVEIELRSEPPGARILVQAATRGPTGVEMEALTGASVAALALIDMVKSVERGATVESVRLELKEGGRSGRWIRDGFEDPFPSPAGGPEESA
jgi:cyclic pyranopterin phosphate synthase